MNVKRIYHSIPDRVRLGAGGLLLATGFLCGPRLLAWWIMLWN